MSYLILYLDQLIGDLLEGTSGKIIWGILQLLLTILGNVGMYLLENDIWLLLIVYFI